MSAEQFSMSKFVSRRDRDDAMLAEIERLRAEVAGLREALAQKVVDQTMLTGLTVQDGGLTMGLQGGAAGLLAEMLAQQFKDGGGINYLQLSFTSSVTFPGEALIVTVQKCSGKTPHQLRMEAEAEAAQLREDAVTLRAERDNARADRNALMEDAVRLDWLMLNVSGMEFRRIGIEYSGNCNRAAIDAARGKP